MDGTETAQTPTNKPANKTGKKGKKFIDTNTMLELVNAISTKEETRVKTKMDRHLKTLAADKESAWKAKQRKREKNLLLKKAKESISSEKSAKKRLVKEAKLVSASHKVWCVQLTQGTVGGEEERSVCVMVSV
ncbi:hypothetical protein HDU91_001376 [Kappamyces sp. JEL0680]|nr:hypothetical protein HDU91_001376 [Kappamyces sp. JEL0680]